MPGLTASDLADFAERYAETPWAVYVQGIDRVLTSEIPDVPGGALGNRVLERETAIALAEQLVEDAASITALHGVTVEMTAYVLHHGIVWTVR